MHYTCIIYIIYICIYYIEWVFRTVFFTRDQWCIRCRIHWCTDTAGLPHTNRVWNRSMHACHDYGFRLHSFLRMPAPYPPTTIPYTLHTVPVHRNSFIYEPWQKRFRNTRVRTATHVHVRRHSYTNTKIHIYSHIDDTYTHTHRWHCLGHLAGRGLIMYKRWRGAFGGNDQKSFPLTTAVGLWFWSSTTMSNTRKWQ